MDPTACDFLFLGNTNSINFASSLTITNNENSIVKLKTAIIDQFHGIDHPEDGNKLLQVVIVQRILKVKDFEVFKYVSDLVSNNFNKKLSAGYNDDIISPIQLKDKTSTENSITKKNNNKEKFSNTIVEETNDETINKKIRLDGEDDDDNELTITKDSFSIKKELEPKQTHEPEQKKIQGKQSSNTKKNYH